VPSEYIHFVTAGGTIDKDYAAGRGTHDFTIGEPAVTEALESLVPGPKFEYEVQSVVRDDSLDMDDADRAAVAEACDAAPGTRVVVTHGTDTMVETAAVLPADKTVVVTGAARPRRMRDSDADLNLGTAIGAVRTLDSGVYIAMNGRVYPRDEVEKAEDGQFVSA
jgi:L-asparaginase